MKSLFPFHFSIVLLGCGGGDTPSTTPDTKDTDTLAGVAAISWTGYYVGTLPDVDGVARATHLWVRSDSTFVRQRSVEGGGVAMGNIGLWSVENGSLRMDDSGAGAEYFHQVPSGLQQVDAGGKPLDAERSVVWAKLAEEPGGDVPRMRLHGTFTYHADAMSFTPCGSELSWPCAGGEDWTDEGEARGSLSSADLQQHYLRSVSHGNDPWTIEVECTLAMGPAMEGDGADEYVFIHRVLGSTSCP